jgi:hypothetical protein
MKPKPMNEPTSNQDSPFRISEECIGTPAQIVSLTEAEYRQADGLSQSLFKKFCKSPKHYLEALKNPKEPTKDMLFGTCFHAVMLQPDPFSVFAVKKKVDGRTADGKKYNADFSAENAGRVVIDEEEYARIKLMKESVLEHPEISRLYEKGVKMETPIIGKRTCLNGEVITLKGLLDMYDEETGIIYDFKKVKDAGDSFKWSCKDFRYDLQAIHYGWLVTMCGLPFNGFKFIAVEDESPHCLGVYKLSSERSFKTFQEWQQQMDYFAECKQKDIWAGYTQDTKDINF